MRDDNAAEEVTQVGVRQRWERALKAVADGNARLLLELLLSPTSTDGQGNPLTFEPLPDDQVLRHRVVRALMARPDWAAGNIGKWWTHVGRGRQKPALSPFEVSVVQVVADLVRNHSPRGSKPVIDFDKLAEAYGVEPETLRRRVGKTRRKTRNG